MVKNENTVCEEGMSIPAYIIYVKKKVCSFYSQKVDNIVKWAAIVFMLIRWSKIKTHLQKSVIRILHTYLC